MPSMKEQEPINIRIKATPYADGFLNETQSNCTEKESQSHSSQ